MVDARGVVSSHDTVVRPRRSLLTSGVTALAIAGVPLFGVLYWLSFSQGSWQRVAVANVVYLLCCLILWLLFRAGLVRVDESSITKRTLLRRLVLPRLNVATVLLSQTYRGSSSDTVPQLLALDNAGLRLFRMRGIYWSRDAMRQVAEAIGAPMTIDPVPMSLREYYQRHPGVAYWYEGRPWIAVVGGVVAFAVAVLAIGWLMTALGVPVAYLTATSA